MRAHAQAPEDSARSRIGKDGQMPPAGDLDHAGTPRRWLRRRRIIRQTHIAHRVGKCQQIIGRWFRLLLHYEPYHFPTSRCRERLCVLLAQVVTVRFRLARQRTQDSRGVPIGVRQGRGGGTLAPCSRTAARPHVPTVLRGRVRSWEALPCLIARSARCVRASKPPCSSSLADGARCPLPPPHHGGARNAVLLQCSRVQPTS